MKKKFNILQGEDLQYNLNQEMVGKKKYGESQK